VFPISHTHLTAAAGECAADVATTLQVSKPDDKEADDNGVTNDHKESFDATTVRRCVAADEHALTAYARGLTSQLAEKRN
jgi:hypothetical protein